MRREAPVVHEVQALDVTDEIQVLSEEATVASALDGLAAHHRPVVVGGEELVGGCDERVGVHVVRVCLERGCPAASAYGASAGKTTQLRPRVLSTEAGVLPLGISAIGQLLSVGGPELSTVPPIRRPPR